nr:PDZ domain-containing protein [Fimbriimonadaceae bacterium]
MKFLKFIGFCVLLFGLFAFGYAWRDISRGSLPNGETMGALLNAKPKRAAIAPNQMFSEAYSTILAGYYKEFDGRSLKYAGMEGLMASLGDPHTMFMEPKETQAFAMETSANFVGVGARLSPDPAGAKIAVVFDDGPAQKIGLKVGDLITNVDGAPMAGKDIDDIVSRIRGKAGTRVTITVVRDGVKKPLEFKPTRAKI